VSHQPKLNLEIYKNINKCKQKMQVNKSKYKITKQRYAMSGDGLKKKKFLLWLRSIGRVEFSKWFY